MKKIIIFPLLLLTVFQVNAQNEISDLLEKLNAKIQVTNRSGINSTNPAYTVNMHFDDAGIHLKYSDHRGGWYLYKWSEMIRLSFTNKGRVRLYFQETHGETFEMITPTSQATPKEIIGLIDQIIYEKTGKNVIIYENAHNDESDLTPQQNNSPTSYEPWIMKEEAPLVIGLIGGGLVVAILLLLMR